jgi:hypothetical protein
VGWGELLSELQADDAKIAQCQVEMSFDAICRIGPARSFIVIYY